MHFLTIHNQSSYTDLIEQSKSLLQSENGLILLACLAGFAVLSLLNNQGKGILATGHWATHSERGKAHGLAIKQIRTRQHNEVALSIGPPGDKKALHLPDMQRGTAVIGAPGSGKSYSMIDPMVMSALYQGFPVILYDFKYPTQTARLAPLAKHLGYDVRGFAPGFPESEVCNLLDFMRNAKDATMAREVATVLYRNMQTSTAHPSEDPFFTQAGEQAIVGGLTLAKDSPYPDLMMVQSILGLPNLPGRLRHARTLSSWARINFDQLMSVEDSEKTAASILGTASGYFNRFMTPSLLSAFVGKTTLPLDLTGRQMIVLGLDQNRRNAIGPLLATLLHMLIVRNVAGPRQKPLIASIDELPTLYLPYLVQWINEYREKGLVILYGAQNLAQLEQRYNRAQARAIFGACATKVIFNPGEPESAQYFSNFLGDEEVRFTETSRGRSGGRTNTTRSPQRRIRKLFEPAQFLRLLTGEAIIISPGFSGRREGSLPLRTKIKVPKTVNRLISASHAAWKPLRQALIQHSQQQRPTEADLRQRAAYAEELLPPPPSSEF